MTRFTSHTTFRFALASAALVALSDSRLNGQTRSAAPRTADQIVADLNVWSFAVDPNLPEAERKAQLKDKFDRRKEIAAKRMELAEEMLRVAPDDPRSVEAMRQRWMMMIGMQNPNTLAECSAVIERGTPAALVPLARLAKVNYATVMRADKKMSLADAMPIYQDFLDHPTNDNDAASVMSTIAIAQPTDQQIATWEQIQAKYPTTPTGEMSATQLKRLRAIGQPFPLDFVDVLSGKRVTTQSLAGKVVLIDFWATWCGPCVKLLPELQALYAEYHDKGLEIIGVSLDKSPEEGGLAKLKAFTETRGMKWPQKYEGKVWDCEFPKQWGVIGIPALFILDQQGRLVTLTGNEEGNLKARIAGMLDQPTTQPAR